MGTFVLPLLIYLVISVEATDMNEYWGERLKLTKSEIARFHIQELPPVEIKSYNVHGEPLWTEVSGKSCPFLVNATDSVLILLNNQILMLPNINEPLSNDTPSLQQVALTQQDYPIKFVRSIVWKSLLYLLLCHETGSCSLYVGANAISLTHRQTIRHMGFPMDAHFFSQANRLYLVVADNYGDFRVPSLIYHWTGTYMDIVAETMTTGAISVTTFKYKQSTIIIFAESNDSNGKIGSEVYEFRESSVERIQLLPATKPISVHHYSYNDFDFVLLINKGGPGIIFWWDGEELLYWLELLEIEQQSLVEIIHVKEDTFFFITQNNVVRLYAIQSMTDYTPLDPIILKINQTIIDMKVWTHGSLIIMVLVTKSDDLYYIGQWEVHIKDVSHSFPQGKESSTKCLLDLIESLQGRMMSLENAAASWPLLLSASENQTILEPLNIPNLILDSGSIETIIQDSSAFSKIEKDLDDLTKDINNTLSASRQTLNSKSKRLIGDVVVEADAYFDEIIADSMQVNFFNDVDIRASLIPKGEQKFNVSLRGGNITIHELEVASLCGIPFDHWARINETINSKIVLGENDQFEIINDTIFVRSNLSVPNIKIKTLNEIDIDRFLNELFVIGHNQTIKGKITYLNSLQIKNLTVSTLNGIPAENFLTRTTDQNSDDFFARSLKIKNLQVDTINSVPVDEAARVSRDNLIKGEVRLTGLRVTKELIVETKTKISDIQPLQTYTNVTVLGDVTLKNLHLKDDSKFFLDDQQLNLDSILKNLWTKSTNQIIKNIVTLEKGVTIDRLDAKYLNGFTENEFLYTTVKEIPEIFQNLYFNDFYVNDSFLLEEEAGNLYDVAHDSITIHKPLHLQKLNVNALFTSIFNDVPVIEILNEQPQNFSKDMNVPFIKSSRVIVQQFYGDFLNNQNLSRHFEHALYTDKNYDIDSIKTSMFHSKNLTIQNINGIDMRSLVELKNITTLSLENLIINGDLIVENDLKIKEINGLPSEIYLKKIAESNITLNSNSEIDNLIVQNISLHLLHGKNVDDLFNETLSKSKEQTIAGWFSFYKISTRDLTTEFINDQNTSKLIWIDEPLTIFGNVTFTDLFVEKDVITRRLNDRDVHELYDNLLIIPSKQIVDLNITGNVSWEETDLNRSNSLTFLLENAVTKDSDQIIYGDTTFNNDISVSSMIGELPYYNRVRKIILDTVIDNGQTIEINGKKIFKEDVIVNSLSVSSNVDISTINDINILEFNNSVINRKYPNTILHPITFLEEVAINKMFVNNTMIHGVPISTFYLANETLPDNIVFKNLIVLGETFLQNLDEIEFEEFINNRVTLTGNHEISANVQFNGFVQVSGNTTLKKINGIKTSDLILNDTQEFQVISGEKKFINDLVVDGNFNATLINNIDLLKEYQEGIENDEDVEIFGDIIFEAHVLLLNATILSEQVNGMNLTEVLPRFESKSNESFRILLQNEEEIEDKIHRAAQAVETLNNIFSYLETEQKLSIKVPNVHKVNVAYFESTTKLNLFSSLPGDSCGLPNNCSCPTQYVAEISENGCRFWRTENDELVWNFHEPNGMFGLNVVSNAVSSSPHCTSENVENEYTTISWMRVAVANSERLVENIKNPADKIQGFLKDAKIFVHGIEVYIILAMYYDPSQRTHHTNSLVYKLNFETEDLALHQTIPIHGAWSLDLFKLYHDPGLHLLIGCFGNPCQSSLYRFNPVTLKFIPLREFASRSRYVKSLSHDKDRFVLLDDPGTNAVNIFQYNSKFDNFYIYQSLFYDSRVNGIECFYADEFGHSDAFVIVTTEDGELYVYEYMFAGKFQIKVRYAMDDVQTTVPFYLMNRRYILVGRSTNSTILRIVEQGPH